MDIEIVAVNFRDRELAFVCEILIENFEEQLEYLRNPEPNMIGIPEWYCSYCGIQEINDSAGITHLEKHIEEMETILKSNKYTHYFNIKKSKDKKTIVWQPD